MTFEFDNVLYHDVPDQDSEWKRAFNWCIVWSTYTAYNIVL